MESQVLTQIDAVIGLLKWLVALQAVLAAVALVLVASAGYFLYAMREHRAGDLFRLQAEDLLGRGEVETVIRMARSRLETHPSDVWVHWYLAQGYFRKQAWPDARHAFRTVVELEPSWYASVEDYMDRIEEGLIDVSPRLVD